MRFNEFKLVETASDPEVLKAQQELKKLGYNLGTFGPNGDGLDGIIGPWTLAAMLAHKKGIKPEQAQTPAPSTPNTEVPDAVVQRYGIDPNKPSGFGLKPDATTSTSGLKLPINAKVGQQFKGIDHPGVDIPVPIGTPVQTPISGRVLFAGFHRDAGNYVDVSDGNGRQRFLHLSQLNVRTGDNVKAGDVIGLSGNTGRSTGPHLHWEKWAGNNYNTAVNPLA